MPGFDPIGALLALVAPQAAYRRAAWLTAARDLQALSTRRYAAARRDRLTNDWYARGSSADAELTGDIATLRNRCRQMVRDNTYIAAALRNLTASLVGDGITARAVHPDPDVAARAQDLWDAWAASKVDGERDFYGVQKLAVRGMVEGGETLQVWQSQDGEPDVGLRLLEGDFLDTYRNRHLPDGGRIVAGVEFDPRGVRRAYWLFPTHPGDALGPSGGLTTLAVSTDARDVDHLYESLRAGQTRGVPWFAPALVKVRDVEETAEAIRIKKRVEACLSVFRKPGDGVGSPLGERTAQAATPPWETLRPGMIIQGQPGEDISVINPSQSGDGDGFLRGQLMAAAAAIGVPYHVVTGDVSQANYSSLRADLVGYYARLDDWTFNDIIPRQCDPAFARQMRRAALKQSRPELARVTAVWTAPDRPWVDPQKDMAAEIMEMRAIPGTFAKACARRGLDWRKEILVQAEINKLLDATRVALDSDPRRLDGTGKIQAAAPYLAQPQPPAANAA